MLSIACLSLAKSTLHVGPAFNPMLSKLAEKNKNDIDSVEFMEAKKPSCETGSLQPRSGER